jgi:hypothetical protein
VNPRERTLATLLLGAVGLAVVAFLFYEFYLVPLADRQERILIATKKDAETDKRIKKVADEKQEMAEWRKWSLPADVIPLRYQQLLETLIQRSDIQPGRSDIPNAMEVKRSGSFEAVKNRVGEQRKEPAYTSLSFTVIGRADLPHLLRLLEQFYSQPLLHRIKLLSIGKSKTGANGKPGVQTARDLQVRLEVEAIVVNGAERRDDVLPKKAPPPGNLARLPGAYQALASKNIFFGPPPAAPRAVDGTDPAASVYLTSISTTVDSGDLQVTLFDMTDNTIWYLYPERQRDIKNIFELKNKSGEVVAHQVTRVHDNEVIFRVGEQYYSLVLGKTVAEALQKPLTEAQVKALEPSPAAANHPIRTAENNGAQ